jgi:hypothetical protein
MEMRRGTEIAFPVFECFKRLEIYILRAIPTSFVMLTVRDAGPGLDGQTIYSLKIIFLKLAVAAILYGTHAPKPSVDLAYISCIRTFPLHRDYVDLYSNVRMSSISVAYRNLNQI